MIRHFKEHLKKMTIQKPIFFSVDDAYMNKCKFR